MLDFAECERLVSSARDKRSKPVANNTRVEKRDEDTYALRLHATDIATYHRDGRITINAGGWRTVTTSDRLRGFVTHQLYSDHGIWYVDCEPDPSDPKPARGGRTVPKPFHALDPGPEPVKPAEGCIAGTETREEWDEERLVSYREIEPGTSSGWRENDIVREYEHDSDYFAGYVMQHRVKITHWRSERYGWHTELPSGGVGTDVVSEQCPHCKLFDAQHDAWESAMNGGGWGRNQTYGYAKMVELLRDYGMIRKADEPAARKAWQQAYIADFRAAREQRKVYRAWVDRNRVTFEDGMELTANGYAQRPDLKAIAREQRKLKRIEKQKKRINKFVADAVGALANGLPLPSGGDCWGCAFRAEDRSVEPMGTDHLEQHIKERYYVPSMFVNALREHGYPDVGIYMHLGMDPDNDRMGGERISRDTITRDLRRYLYKRLVPELARR